jgi:hypothetical protein
VHGDPGESGQHPGGVDRLRAAFAMAEQAGEPGAGGDVQPVQPAGHPQSGLVQVQHLRVGQRGAGGGGERCQPGRGPARPGRHRAGRHRGAEQLGQQSGGALDRQVLAQAQIHGDAAACGP